MRRNEKFNFGEMLIWAIVLAVTIAITTVMLLYHQNKIPSLISCTEHIDENVDMFCDVCSEKLPFSNYSETKNIEIISDDGSKIEMQGNMPKDVTAEVKSISKDESVDIAKKYIKDLKDEDIFGGYDITMYSQMIDDNKYQPAEFDENVSVYIHDMDVDINENFALLHIIDDENFEVIPLRNFGKNDIEFETTRFSKYILITVATHTMAFSGDGNFVVRDINGVEIVNNSQILSYTNFVFDIFPAQNYELIDVKFFNALGNDVTSSINMTVNGNGRRFIIDSVEENYTVSISTEIVLITNITFWQDSTAWTNQNQVIGILWPETILTKQIKIGDGDWQNWITDSVTITENTTIKARIFDGEKYSNEYSYTVTNIDKEAPEFDLTTVPDTWTSGSVQVFLNATDNLSGIVATSTSSYAGTGYLDRYEVQRANTMSIDNLYYFSTGSLYIQYVRLKDAAGNTRTKTIRTDNVIDATEPIISDAKNYTEQEYYDKISRGKMLHTDPMFKNGYNSVSVYNNYGNGNVTTTRVLASSEGITNWTGSSSAYIIKITTKNEATPGLGGFYQGATSQPSRVYIHRFIAKIPEGYYLEKHNNSVPGSTMWLTSKAGTGEWKEYAYIWRCASEGNYSSFGHLALYGTPGTDTNPVVWYLSYSTLLDMTHVFDDVYFNSGDLTLTYSDAYNKIYTSAADVAQPTITIVGNDYQSGVASITVNGVSQTLIGSGAQKTAVYNVTQKGTYNIIVTDAVGRSQSISKTIRQITYDGNGATGGSTESQLKMDGINIYVKANGFTNSSGVPFRGWSTTPGGEVEYEPGRIFSINADTTLYAVWSNEMSWDVSMTKGTDNVKATLTPNASTPGKYIMTVSGTGRMKDFAYSDVTAGNLPWNDYKANVNKVIIESGVTRIGANFTYNHTSLTSTADLIIPDSVTSIGSIAFRGASNLYGPMNISRYVTSISSNPYSSCRITEFIVDPNNPNYTSVDGVLYTKDESRIVAYPSQKQVVTYEVLANTKVIGESSFNGAKITNLVLPEGLTTIGSWTFGGSTINNVSIPSTVTSIAGDGMFSGVSALKNVYIHTKALSSIPRYSFSNIGTSSKIHTLSRTDMVPKFVDGYNYTASRTTISYPPYISTQPSNVKAGYGSTATFSVGATAGNPSETIRYQWEISEDGGITWRDATDSDGTGKTTNIFTTKATTIEMQGNKYRCRISCDSYPGIYFTEEELEGQMLSTPAELILINANYSFGGLIYETWAEVYLQYKRGSSAGVGTIAILRSHEDSSVMNIEATYQVTINTNGNTVIRTTPITNNGTLIINGVGGFETKNDATNTVSTLINNNNILTINGATIENKGLTSGNWIAVENKTANSIINLNDGSIKATKAAGIYPTGYGMAIYDAVGGTTNINGGTVSQDGLNGIAICNTGANGGNLNIMGGNVTSVLGTGIKVTSASGQNVVSTLFRGGTIYGGTNAILFENTAQDLIVNGSNIFGKESALYNAGSGAIRVISGTVSSDEFGIYSFNSSPVRIEGGTINAGISGIENDGGAEIRVLAGNINATSTGIRNSSNGTVIIEGGKVTGNETGIYNRGTGIVTIKGGIVEGSFAGAQSDIANKLIIGQKDGNANILTPTVKGQTYGVYAGNGFKFFDGKIMGKDTAYIKGSISETEENYNAYVEEVLVDSQLYKVAILQPGWDISDINEVTSSVWASLAPDEEVEGKYILYINGSGPMRNFETYDSVPWKSYRNSISKVEMTSGLTAIGSRAFYKLINVENITIPSTVTRIGDGAFSYCDMLDDSILIPISVTNIGNSVFLESPLKSIIVDGANSGYKSEDGVLFNKAGTTLITYPQGKTEETYIIPSTVSTIAEGAFYKTQAINITFPDNLLSIGNNAFLSSEIGSVILKENLINIGTNAFYDSSNLESIYILSQNVNTIGTGAFINIGDGATIKLKDGAIRTLFNINNKDSEILVYYPPKITKHPTDQSVIVPTKAVFTVEVEDGYPGGITYQWQIKRSGDIDWSSVTLEDGTGGTTNTFTTYETDESLSVNAYRCEITGTMFPEDTVLTREVLGRIMTSEEATISIEGQNYGVGRLYYPTLAEAYAAITGNEGTIVVQKTLIDETLFTVEASKNITIDTNGKTITKLKTPITNNGTLNIIGTGGIATVESSDNEINYLVVNSGILNIRGATLKNAGITSGDWGVIENQGTGQIDLRWGGNIIAARASEITTTGTARNVLLNTGTLRINDGTLLLRNVAGYNIEKNNTGNALIYFENGTIKNETANPAIYSNINTSVSNQININMTGGLIESVGKGILLSSSTNGTIEILAGTVSTGSTAIDHKGTGAVNLEVATINANDYGVSVDEDATISISGTRINVLSGDGIIIPSTNQNNYSFINGVIDASGKGIIKAGTGTLNLQNVSITGGTIGIDIQATSSGDITLSGGSVTGESSYAINKVGNGKITLTSCTLNSVTSNAINIISDNGDVDIVSGNITSPTTAIYYNPTLGTLRVLGGTITGATRGIENAGERNLIVTAGTINGGILNSSSGSITIDGGNIINSSNECILNNGAGLITINNVNMQGQTGVKNNSTGNVIIYEGTINTVFRSMYNTSSGSMYIRGGDFKSLERAICNEGTGTLEIGTPMGGADSTNPYIIGATYGVYSEGGFGFYDGILRGKIAAMYGNPQTDPGYNVKDSITTVDEENYYTAQLQGSFRVDTSEFITLQSAYNSITTTGTIVVEGTNVIDSSNLVVASGKIISIDVNNKTLRLTNSIINNGELNIIGTGIINPYGGANNIVENNGIFKLNGPTLESTNNESATTVSTINNNAGGTVIITSGKVIGIGLGDSYAINTLSGGTTIIGTTGGEVVTTNPEIIGGTYALAGNGTYEFYDGALRGKTDISEYTISEMEEEYAIYLTDELYYFDLYKKGVLSLASYYDDTNYYLTLQEAIDKTTNGGTIKIIRDVSDNEDVLVPAGKTITIDLNNNALTKTMYPITNEGTLIIDGLGIITSDVNVIYGGSGSNTTIKDGTITSTSDTLIFIGSSNVNIEGGTITSTGANNASIIHNGTGNVTIGVPGGVPSKTNPNIKGTTYAIQTVNGFSYYDGVLRGAIASYTGSPTVMETDYTVRKVNEDVEGLTYQKTILELASYADGSNNTYAFLDDAITGTLTGDTITVLRDITDNTVATIPGGKTLSIYLNNKTITKTVNSIKNDGTLTIEGSGTITAINDGSNILTKIIETSGVLIIDDGTIINTGSKDANANAIYVAGGTIEINGGIIKTVISPSIGAKYYTSKTIQLGNNVTLNITGGTVKNEAPIGTPAGSLNTSAIYSYGNAGGAINISGGMIENTTGTAISNDSAGINPVVTRISGGNVKGTYGIENSVKTNGVIIVSDGTVIGTVGHAISNQGTGRVIVGEYGEPLNKPTPVIQGKTVGITATNGIEFYDGELIGKSSSYTGTIALREPNYELQTKTKSIEGENYNSTTLKRNIGITTITLSQTEYEYDGTAKRPEVTVMDGEKTLVEGVDYTLLYLNNINAGVASVRVIGSGDYLSVKEASYIIKKIVIDGTALSVDQTFVYDGTIQTMTITNFNSELLEITNNEKRNAGIYNARVSILYPENYEWEDGTTEPKYFEWIIARKEINLTWGEENVFTYDGNPHAPTVYWDNPVIGETVEVSRTTNINAGEYTAEAYVTNVFGGQMLPTNYELLNTTRDYVINKFTPTFEISSYSVNITNGNEVQLTYTYNGELSLIYSSANENVAIIRNLDSVNNIITIEAKGAGSTNLIVTAPADINHNEVTKIIAVTSVQSYYKVEGLYYVSLQEAINACVDNSTILLIRDVTETTTATNSKDITLDLNGHYIIANMNGTYITNNGELQIINTSASMRNIMSSRTENIITNNGTLNLNEYITISGQTHAITNNLGATLDIENTIINSKTTAATIVNSGTITSNRCSIIGNSIAINNSGVLNIPNSGAMSNVLISGDTAISNTVSGIFTISNSTIYGKISNESNGNSMISTSVLYNLLTNGIGINTTNGKVTIHKSTIDTVGNNFEIVGSNANIEISESTLRSENHVAVVSGGKLTIYANSTADSNQETILINAGGSIVNITDTILTNYNNVYVINNSSNSTVTIQDTTISSASGKGIYNIGTLNANGCYITTQKESITNANSATFIDSQISSTESTAFTSSGTLTIKGNTEVTAAYGISNSGTLILGENNATIEEKPTIDAQRIAVANNGVMNWYDGELTGRPGETLTGNRPVLLTGVAVITARINDNIEKKYIEVDVTNPEITGVITETDWTINTQTIQVIATDNAEVASYAITLENLAPSSNSELWQSSNTFTVNQNSIYYVWAKDTVGNVVSREVEIKWICKSIWDTTVGGGESTRAILEVNGTLRFEVVARETNINPNAVGAVRSYTSSGAPWANNATINAVYICEGITGMGDYSLAYLPNVLSLTISSTVNSITLTTLYSSNNYQTINLDVDNMFYMNRGLSIYNVSNTTLYSYSTKNTETNLSLDNTVLEIAPRAFYRNTNLTRLTIDKNVTSVGIKAFENFTGDVYYYASNDTMVNYVATYPSEAHYVMIDDIRPIVTSIVINNNDISTVNPVVTIEVQGYDNIAVDKMYISETRLTENELISLSTSSWIAYSSYASFTLSGGVGIKNVYLWIKDTSRKYFGCTRI